MKTKRTCFWLALAALSASALIADLAHAQLFRPQNRFGGGRRAAQLNQEAGSLSGRERFLRANRRASDFVGGDSRDNVGFVGATESGRRATPTRIEAQTTDRSASINRPAPVAQAGRIYPPRLTVAFAVSAASGIAPSTLDRIQATLVDRGLVERQGLAVRSNGSSLVLNGTAPSDHQRRLAELLASFEPGVSRVENRLRVRGRSVEELRRPTGR